MRHLPPAPALLVVLGLLVSACGAPSAAAAVPVAPAAEQRQPAESEEHDTATPDRVVPAPADATRIHAFGFVRAVDASRFPATVTFDEARFLDGMAAETAFIADHGYLPEGGLPNDYYISNPEPELTTLPMAGNVVIHVVAADGTATSVAPGQWAERVVVNADGEATWYEPYHLVIVDGTVVEVRGQYLP
jgi:hypothetical protein